MINAGELCKFDGKDFTYYPLKNDIQETDENTELTELSSGEIMLRSSQFAKFNPKTETFIYYSDPPIEASSVFNEDGTMRGFIPPNNAPFDRNGNVWYANTKGIYKLFEDSCISLKHESNEKAFPSRTTPTLDNIGNCWSATKKGLYQLNKDSIIKYDLIHFGFDSNTFVPEIKFVTETEEILFKNTYGTRNKKGEWEVFDKHFYLLKNNRQLDTLSFLTGKRISSVCKKQELFYFLIDGIELLEYNSKDNSLNQTFISKVYGEIALFGDELIFHTRTSLLIIKGNASAKINYNWRNYSSITVDNNHNIWMASRKGLIRYSIASLNYQPISYSQDPIFKNPDKGIIFTDDYDILDNENNIWFIIDEMESNEFPAGKQNLYKYNVSSKKVQQILSNKEYFNLFWDNDNNTMWISADDKFYLSKNGAITKTTLDNDFVLYLFKNGVHYGFNIDGGVAYRENNTFKFISNDYGLLDTKQPKTLYVGDIRARSGQEIFIINEETKDLNHVLKADSQEWVFRAISDFENGHWMFSSKNQKVYYVNQTLKTKKEKAYQNSGLRNYNIVTAADKSGNVWVSSNMGINYLTIDHDTIKSELISKQHSLSSTIINNLYVDEYNYLWIATDNGVDRLNGNKYLQNKTVDIEHFGQKEGLKNVNCSKFEIRNNELIVFTDDGFATIDTSRTLTTLDAPSPYFKDLDYIIDEDLIRHNLKDRAEPLEIDNPFAQIYVMFNAIKFNNTAPLEYKAVLYNNNEEIEHGRWSDKEEVKFHELDPGKYKVELYCRVGTKGKPSEPTILEFKILPAWWQTWWFEGIMILVALGLIYLLYKWRTNALIKRQKELEQTVKEKTAEANRERDIAHEQKEIIEEAHREITDSINYAERIQRSFLATKELLDENLKDYFVFFQPKEAVSGDFYWAGKLDNGNFAVVNADSTGHGVPGAIMSILNISSIEKAIEQKLTAPSEIFNATRNTIIERLKKDGSPEGGKDGMDASIISFDFANQKFSYTAANNPIWVVRNGQVIIIKADKMPVGKHDNDHIPFTEAEFELQKGDVVYTITDGFQDQFGGEKGKKFMVKRLRELLLSISHLPMQEQEQELNNIFFKWKGNEEQVDDVCVIGVRV